MHPGNSSPRMTFVGAWWKSPGGSDPAAENAGFFSVSDPACGAGALLIAFANLCRRKNICYHDKVLFVAQDIDLIAGLMCYIQLSFLGCA